jgi:hypothetical protein
MPYAELPPENADGPDCIAGLAVAVGIAGDCVGNGVPLIMSWPSDFSLLEENDLRFECAQ